MQNVKIIRLDDNIFSNLYIETNSDFKQALFDKILLKKNVSQLAQIAQVSNFSLQSWINGTRPIKFIPFRKLCESEGISEKILMENILFFKTRLNAGKTRFHEKNLVIDDNLAELIGFVKGDGCIHKKYVELSNTDLKTVFYYTCSLLKTFGLEKNQIEVTIAKPQLSEKYPHKEAKYSRNIGFTRLIIRQRKTYSKKIYAKKPIIRCRLNSKIIALIFSQIKSQLYETFQTAPRNIQRSFVRGYAAAEGAVTSGKRISLCQNNIRELFFLQKLLINLGYKSAKHFSKTKEKQRISIYGYSELTKYAKEIGFGANNKRNEQLKSLLAAYTQFTRVPIQQNYERILNIIIEQKEVNAPELCLTLEKSYKETSRLLKELVDLGRLRANTQNKPYIYTASQKPQ
ncbi:MAG: LAGLIDADG family homing endonuclease [archaeon]